MKKLSLLFLFSVSISAGFSQKVAGTASVHHGKIVFIEANPATPFRHQATVVCSMASPDNFERMLYHMIEKKAKELNAETGGVPFDALIFRPGTGFCKADLVLFYSEETDKKKKKSDDEVNEAFRKSETLARHGINLFVENEPAVPFTLLGKLELPQNFQTEKYEEMLDQMVLSAKGEYPDANGIVIRPGTELRKADIIKIE